MAAVALVIVLALVGGLITTVREARRANRRFDDVRRLADSILFEIEPQIAYLAGSTQARATLVKRSLEYLDSLSREAGGNRELRLELAAAYQKVGNIQGNPNVANLGDIKGALVSFAKAKTICLRPRQSRRARRPGPATGSPTWTKNTGQRASGGTTTPRAHWPTTAKPCRCAGRCWPSSRARWSSAAGLPPC